MELTAASRFATSWLAENRWSAKTPGATPHLSVQTGPRATLCPELSPTTPPRLFPWRRRKSSGFDRVDRGCDTLRSSRANPEKEACPLATSNASVARQYLQAVESLGPLEDVAAFYSPDVVFQEFPNRIAPQGRIRRAGDLSAAYQKGQQLLRSQTYAVQRILEAGGNGPESYRFP